MKISYKKWQLNSKLILAVIWLVYFLVRLFSNVLDWLDYGWLIFSIGHFCLYFYQKKYQYILLENGILMINGPWGKQFNLAEITQIKKFAGDYIIKTPHREVTISTHAITPKDLPKLDEVFQKINIERE